MVDRVVIAGAGQGGFQAAASLRQDGFEGAITLIGDEPGLPYQRPPLSKAYMATGDADRLALRPADFYDAQNILRLENDAVVSIDREAHRVVTQSGATHDYDHLVLALGASNARPPIDGLDMAAVWELRTLAHAEGLRARMADMRHALVVGGGFIGLEFASVARKAGIDVTVIEAAPRLMARVVSPELSAIAQKTHLSDGVVLKLGAAAVRIEADENTGSVTLEDGRVLSGDTVLLAVGVRPNTGLAEAAGLEIDNGIVVDATLRTSDPDISAIGDCAAFPAPGSGEHIRLESVQAATDHARAVSRRLTGSGSPYSALPWFWSDQGSMKIQIAGIGAGCDSHEVLRDADGVAVIACFTDEKLIAVETINAPGDHMGARKLLELGAPTRDELHAADGDLRALAKASMAAARG